MNLYIVRIPGAPLTVTDDAELVDEWIVNGAAEAVYTVDATQTHPPVPTEEL